MNDRVYSPLRKNLIVIYDQSTNYISFMFKVLKEHQAKVMQYIKDHYSNVQVMIKDSWMRLDYNKDGQVSKEDLQKGVHELYEFIINYEYLQKAIEIKNKLYNEAIKYMQKDLNEDGRKKESKVDENDQKAQKSTKEDWTWDSLMKQSIWV